VNRPDLVSFVNGLPLVVIELKKPGVPARGVREERRGGTLFWFNAPRQQLSGGR
jgi:type I restriction enzyme R subunit